MSPRRTVRLCLCLCLALTLTLACAAPDPEPAAPAPSSPLAQAQQLLGASDFEGAAEVLEEALAEDPEQAAGWQLLGIARRNLGQLDEAAEAYTRSATFPANVGAARTGLLLIDVARGDVDRAAERFAELRTTPGVDLGGLALRPELAALEGDARFADLFPGPEVFDRSPFVEDVQIVHEWRGSSGEAFGWEARRIGDVDGDGIIDAVISAPANAPPGDSRGRVVVVSGKSGAELWQATGTEGSQLGVSVEKAPDVDGDGVPDVAAGAGAGGAFVYSGPTGELIHRFDPPDGVVRFGNKVTGTGDLDGDGHGDVLVGAPGNPQDPDDAGQAFVYSGRDGALLLELRGERGGDGFGTSVAAAVQGDRFWLVIGAPNAGDGNRGRIDVFTDLSGDATFSIDAEESGQQLGAMFLSLVGDIDADGVLDVYATDFSDGARGPQTGRIYVHSGATGERLLTLTGETPGEGFGIGPARAGDLDGDGADDLAIGAWQYGAGAFSGGRVYLYSGREGALLGTITSNVPGETFGFDADGLGDVDGDGVLDLLVTSAWSMVDGPRSGRTFVVSGAGLIGR